MLRFDGFERAVWNRLDPDEAGRPRWSIHYYVADAKRLEAYLDEHAREMRQHGLDRFGGRFTAARRVLYEQETFEG
jgi:hypothetical protein